MTTGRLSLIRVSAWFRWRGTFQSILGICRENDDGKRSEEIGKGGSAVGASAQLVTQVDDDAPLRWHIQVSARSRAWRSSLSVMCSG